MSKVYQVTHDEERILALIVTDPSDESEIDSTPLPLDDEPEEPQENTVSTVEFSDYDEAEAWLLTSQLERPKGLKWSDQLMPLKSRMYAAWKALPDEVRDPFIPYWPAVNLAIDIGDTPEAIRILNAVTVPAELEGVRQAFLDMLS